ncbi:MAG: hypothetical protein AABZ12_10960 [Planctomycetota bacterium]
MLIELTSEELQAVCNLVHERIKELGPEIHHTRSREYRAALENLRAKLESLEARLGSVAA